MKRTNSYLLRLGRVVASNAGVAVLALVGLGVVCNFSDGAMIILLLVVSLLQGGLMVRAFGPVVASEHSLSLGGQAIGWIGFISWFVIHIVNAGVASQQPMDVTLVTVTGELMAYGIVNSLCLIPFLVAPLRERKRRWQEALDTAIESDRQAQDQQERGSDQIARDDARLQCRLLYDRYRSELQQVFPQDVFDSYFTSFLADSTPLDVFEQRAEQLKDMIRDRLQLGVQEQRRFESPEEVIQYFAEQQRRLTALVADDPDVLDTLICDLAEARDKALKELFL